LKWIDEDDLLTADPHESEFMPHELEIQVDFAQAGKREDMRGVDRTSP
jgi:hypothetical protein